MSRAERGRETERKRDTALARAPADVDVLPQRKKRNGKRLPGSVPKVEEGSATKTCCRNFCCAISTKIHTPPPLRSTEEVRTPLKNCIVPRGAPKNKRKKTSRMTEKHFQQQDCTTRLSQNTATRVHEGKDTKGRMTEKYFGAEHRQHRFTKKKTYIQTQGIDKKLPPARLTTEKKIKNARRKKRQHFLLPNREVTLKIKGTVFKRGTVQERGSISPTNTLQRREGFRELETVPPGELETVPPLGGPFSHYKRDF